MIHPSYKELIDKINKDAENEDEPIVTSRYSIVLATSKRARQLTAGDPALVKYEKGKKALSVAVQELYEGKVNIIPGSEGEEELPEEVQEEIAEETAEEIEAAEAPAETEEE